MEWESERGARCTICFDVRFERTALYPHENGFPVMTSSLGISRWKNMAQIHDCGFDAHIQTPNFIDCDAVESGVARLTNSVLTRQRSLYDHRNELHRFIRQIL